MSDNTQQRPQKPKNLLNSPKFQFTTESPIKGSKDRPTLSFYADSDNPGITVYTRDPNDKDNNFGRIVAKFGFLEFQLFVEQLNDIHKLNPGEELAVLCRAKYDSSGNALEKPTEVTKVIVGKRGDGAIFIALEDLSKPGRPKIPFVLRPSYWHYLVKNGEKVSEVDCSISVSKTLYRVLGQVVNQLSVDTYKHVERKPFVKGGGGGGNRGNWNNNRNGGGGGGGYNGGGNSGGGYNGGNQQSSTPSYGGGDSGGSDMSDDVPY